MRWSCPHCGVNLAISDDKLGAGWSFSRCYKCGGFALVRRSEVNLIKVDKAPAGENVLLPEATETPMLSTQATQKLEQYIAKAESKKVVAPETAAQPPIHAPAPVSALPQTLVPPVALPNPLPEVPSRSLRNRVLPWAIGSAATFAVASGIYLYIQGQILWERARTTAAADARASSVRQVAVAGNSAELVQAPSLASANVVVTDQVRQSAMAPARVESPADDTDGMLVKAKNTNARLHSGPGIQYPVIGLIDPQIHYSVVEWNNEWFKIVPKKSVNGREKANSESIWVRNDMVVTVPVSLKN